MKPGERVLQAVAVAVVLFGLFMVVGGIGLLLDPKSPQTKASSVALIVCLGLLPAIAGVLLFRHTQAAAAERALEAREQLVLQVASAHQGVLTVAQVAMATGMSLEQAEAVLDRMHHKSFNDKELLDSGEMVYKFQL